VEVKQPISCRSYIEAQSITDIVSAEFKADPFPLFARLRASDPVYRTTLPDKNRRLAIDAL
jgi:hypothetical protein